MFDVNAKAAFFFIQQAGRRLADGGSVITIVTSLLAAFTDGYATYAGAKSPVEHFTRAAAKEFAARDINVNNVAPGPMDTPFFYGQETAERVTFHRSQAMGNRLTMVEDIAPLVVFLAGEGHWITGQTIFANGGHTTRKPAPQTPIGQSSLDISGEGCAMAGRSGVSGTGGGYSGMFLCRPRRAGASASAWVITLRVCAGSILASTTPISMALSTPPAIRSCSAASSSCRASRS